MWENNITVIKIIGNTCRFLSAPFLPCFFFPRCDPVSLPVYSMPLIIWRCRVQYWEWHNIGSFALWYCQGSRLKGKREVREEGLGIGDETERWDAKRETDRCRAGEIQIFARIPGGSTAAPFNNNLYYFNDLRPRVSVTFVRRPLVRNETEESRLRSRGIECLPIDADGHRFPAGWLHIHMCFPIESRVNFLSYERAADIRYFIECAR